MRIFSDFATGTLLSSVTDTDTILTLQASEGALFPAPDASAGKYSILHIEDTNGNIEAVRLTERVGDSLIVVRAQEGTSARAYAAGTTKVDLRDPSSTYLNTLFQRNEGDVLDADSEIIVTTKRMIISNQEPGTLVEGEAAVNLVDKKVWFGAVGSTLASPLPPVLVVSGSETSPNADNVVYDPTSDLLTSALDVQSALVDHSERIALHSQGGWFTPSEYDLTFNTTNWLTFSGAPKTTSNGALNTTRSDDKIQILNQASRQVFVRCYGSIGINFARWGLSTSVLAAMRFYNVTKAQEMAGSLQLVFPRPNATYPEYNQMHWSAQGLVDNLDQIRPEIKITTTSMGNINRVVRFISTTFNLESISL